MSELLDNKINDVNDVINKLDFNIISSLQDSELKGLDDENENIDEIINGIKNIEDLIAKKHPDHKIYLDMIKSFIQKKLCVF